MRRYPLILCPLAFGSPVFYLTFLVLSFTIGIHDCDQRLDRWLRKKFPATSLGILFACVRKKKVRVNGAVGKAAQKLNAGDKLDIYENLPKDLPAYFVPSSQNSQWETSGKPFAPPSQNAASKLSFALLTPDFAIIEKPCGMPSQSGTGIKNGKSLVDMLASWAYNNGMDFKPTLVHRLDKETSGLIIAALTGASLRELGKLLRERRIKKEYYALVKGGLQTKKGTINLPLQGEDGKKVEAVTHYEVVKTAGECDLVKARIETGRKHQIRLHFALIGHPLYGDSQHGDFAWNRECKKKFGVSRLFLHSSLLEFEWKGEIVRVESPLPSELLAVIEKMS